MKSADYSSCQASGVFAGIIYNRDSFAEPSVLLVCRQSKTEVKKEDIKHSVDLIEFRQYLQVSISTLATIHLQISTPATEQGQVQTLVIDYLTTNRTKQGQEQM